MKITVSDQLINLIVWVFLVMLIIGLYLFADAGFGSGTILLLSLVKFILVGFFYMEVRYSHTIWKLFLIFFAAFYLFVVIILN